MPEQWYSVTLTADVVVTANAATAGGHQALDYLPGSLFAGIAAHRRFDSELLWSGRVRFLDGHPRLHQSPTWRVPLAFHSIKGKEWQNQPPLSGLAELHDTIRQPVQWRSGYMTADGQVTQVVRQSRMKTAINREARRAAEGQLFGYESIPAGLTFMMGVQADTAQDLATVTALLGTEVRLGRSRSAEYGQARLRAIDPPRVAPPVAQGDLVALYLMSDLALQHQGMPVLYPTPAMFGLPDSAVLWPEKCFLQTRRYTPWNAFYNAWTTERQVLVKGSVITFRVPEADQHLTGLQQKLAGGTGLYREEGLGQILVNPDWLLKPPKLTAVDLAPQVPQAPQPQSLLAQYLVEKANRRQDEAEALRVGRQWAREWRELCTKIGERHGPDRVPSKTQWAKIREFAVRYRHQPAELPSALRTFCENAMRRKIWVEAEVRLKGQQITLLSALLDKIGPAPDSRTCLTLYHAALETGRLQQSNA